MLGTQRFIPVMAAAVLTLACGATAPAPDNQADLQAIQQIREREIAAFSSGDLETLVAIGTPDIQVMPPDAPALSGSDATRAWAQAMTAEFTITGRYTDAQVTMAGDYAFERYTGELTLTPKAGGETMNISMKGIHVYQRQPDGSWRIHMDVWNSNAPPSAAAPASGQ